MNLLWPIAIIGLLTYASVGKNAQSVLTNAVVSLKDISLQAGASVLDVIQGLKPLEITVEVTNNLSIGTYINAFNGNATIAGQSVGTVNQELNVNIGAGETVQIIIPVYLDSAAIITVAGESIISLDIPEINFTGTLTASGFSYPVNETIKI